MLQQEGKYLYFAADVTGGQDDQVRFLEIIIIMALSLQRIPIIKEPETDYQHKTSVRYVPFRWASYIDLALTKIAEIMPDGTIEEVKTPFRWVHKKDFNFKAYSGEQIRYIPLSQLYDRQHTHTPVLYIEGKMDYGMDEILIKPTIRKYCKHLHHVTLFPSSRVDDLTDIVLAQFGTNRKSSQYVQASLNFKPRHRKHDFRFNYYICMHIRAEDALKHDKRLYFGMQKEQINHIIQKVCRIHSRNIPIYIMSDIQEHDYFNFLKPKYKIYTYRNFPKLKELFASKHAPVDHNLLYAVEKNIMKYALVKIMPPSRNSLVFDMDASYKIPPYIQVNYNTAMPQLRRRRWPVSSIIYRIKRRLRRELMALKEKFKIRF